MLKKLFVITILSFCAGCSVGPKYIPPCAPMPAHWKNHQGKNCLTAAPADWAYSDHWWHVFQDPQLDQLEQMALENNRDLFTAFQRIEEARALTCIAAADLYPQVTLNPQYTNTGELIKNYNLSSFTLPGITEEAKRVFRAHELLYFLPFNFNYEVDLWGKIRDQVASAKFNWLAEKEEYDAVFLTLTAHLAIAYYQLRLADVQMDILALTEQTRDKAFEINDARYLSGITFYTDVALAGHEIESVAVQYEEIKRQRNLLENQIAVLIGAPASEFCLAHMPLDGSPPCVPEGIPSEILLRRPDLLRAIFLNKAQHAQVKRAYALFFPSLALTATLGFESPTLKDFLTWFSRFWMTGAQVGQVIFDGGRLRANLDLQIARFKETSGEYQQQVLIAFQEVENALANLDSYAEQYESSLAATQWSADNNRIYTDRYLAGITYYINVVNTERDLLNDQLTLTAIQGLRFISTVQLIQALGGDWSYCSLE